MKPTIEFVLSLLDALDGYGLVVTDEDEIEEQLKRLGYKHLTKADVEAGKAGS